MCSQTQLSKLAVRFLQLPPTSAAVERTFSRQSWIHFAKRNRLSTCRVAMIVEIGYNAKLMEDTSAYDATGMNEIADGVSGQYENDSDINSESDTDTLMSLQSSEDDEIYDD